jgi:ketosteroid isomerase-like protein
MSAPQSTSKKSPYRAAFAAMTVAMLVACSQGEGDKPGLGVDVNVKVDIKSAEKTLEEAKAADQAFSDYAQTAGMAEAFAKYMDAVDGKLISPGAVTTGTADIRKAFEAWPQGLKMTWAPDMGHGSASGDLAVTSGRWVRERESKVVAEGRYVTVWRKNEAGEWKGVIDIGAPDPTPAPEPKPDLEGRPG